MMNLCRRSAVLLALGWGLNSMAADDAPDRVLAPMKNVMSLSIYAKPYDAKAQSRLDVKEVSFPLPILLVDGDFLKVQIAGKAAWIDGAEVQISKPVAYTCAKADPKPSKVAAIQGASGGCK